MRPSCCGLAAVDVAMRHAWMVSLVFEMLTQLAGDPHRAVLPTGAPDGDREVALALTLVGGALLVSNATLAAVKATVVDAALMKKLNPDGDGTVDLAEAKAAGKAMFKQLNPDKDGTLDMKELAGRISEADFKAANPDGDGTLDMDEYMALVKKLFKEANPDDDGTLEEAELKSPAGQKLLALIS